MRMVYEVVVSLMLGIGTMAIGGADIFFFVMASEEHREGAGLYAVAAAILTGLLAVALAIYARPGAPADDRPGA